MPSKQSLGGQRLFVVQSGIQQDIDNSVGLSVATINS
jgi:hypothetical protein